MEINKQTELCGYKSEEIAPLADTITQVLSCIIFHNDTTRRSELLERYGLGGFELQFNGVERRVILIGERGTRIDIRSSNGRVEDVTITAVTEVGEVMDLDKILKAFTS